MNQRLRPIASLLLGVCLLLDPIAGQAIIQSFVFDPAKTEQFQYRNIEERFSEEAVDAALVNFYQTYRRSLSSRVDKIIGYFFLDRSSHFHENSLWQKFVKLVSGSRSTPPEFLEEIEESAATAFSAAKRAPGTDDLSNREEQFHLAISRSVQKNNPDGVQEINVPEATIQILEKAFPVDARVFAEIMDLNSGREPNTFNERILCLLRAGRIRFVIEDLSSDGAHRIVRGLANQYGWRIGEFDDALYPRAYSSKNPMGVAGFFEETKESGTGLAIGRIHVTKKAWEEWSQAPNGDHIKAQCVVHEGAERVLGSPEGISAHTFASLLEMHLLSEQAQKEYGGVSDLNLWYLEHAAASKQAIAYFNLLNREYNEQGDPTLGSFYRVFWSLIEKKGLENQLEAKKREGKMLPIRLRPDRFVKKLPGTSVPPPEVVRELEDTYRGRGEYVDTPREIIAWISSRKHGEAYDKLTSDLLQSEKGIVFHIDDPATNEDPVYYHSPSLSGGDYNGILFFLAPNEGVCEIHLKRALWNEMWRDKVAVDDPDAPAFLAQVLVYTYMQNFLPPPVRGLSLHTWAGLSALHFGSRRAQIWGVNDLDIFNLEQMKRRKNVRYFYRLIRNYRAAQDPQGTFLQVIFKTIFESNSTSVHPNNLDTLIPDESNPMISEIKTGEDLLSYYVYLFQYRYADVPLEDRIKLVSEHLEHIARHSYVVRLNLQPGQTRYLYPFPYDGRMVYIPQNIAGFLNFKVLEQFALDPSAVAEVKEKELEMANLQAERDQYRMERNILAHDDIKRERLLTLIIALNSNINTLGRRIASLTNAPFINWLLRATEHERLSQHGGGGSTRVIIGVYGVSSAGKSTLAEMVTEELRKRYADGSAQWPSPVRIDFLGGDSYLHEGNGFRYFVRKNSNSELEGSMERRKMIVTGPSTYDNHAMARDLTDIKKGFKIRIKMDPHADDGKDDINIIKTPSGNRLREIDGSQLEVLVVDLTAFSLDDQIIQNVDILVPIVFANDAVRLPRRLERDTRPNEERPHPGRQLSVGYVIGETAQKQITEVYGAVEDLVKQTASFREANQKRPKAAIWVQDTNTLVELDPTANPESLKESPELVTAQTPYAIPSNPRGLNSVVALFKKNEMLGAQQHGSVREVTGVIRVGGVDSRLRLSVPKGEHPQIAHDYIRAALMNLITIASPSRITLHASDSVLGWALSLVKNELESPLSPYSSIVDRVTKSISGKSVKIDIVNNVPTPSRFPSELPARESTSNFVQLRQLGQDGLAVGLEMRPGEMRLIVLKDSQTSPLFIMSIKTGKEIRNLSEDMAKFVQFGLLMASLEVKGHSVDSDPDLSRIRARAGRIRTLNDVDKFITSMRAINISILPPSSIGISFAKLEARQADLADKMTSLLRNRLGSVRYIPIGVTTIGNAGALWAKSIQTRKDFAAFYVGSSMYWGYVDRYGRSAGKIFDLEHLTLAITDAVPFHQHPISGQGGNAAAMFSELTVARLANFAELQINGSVVPAVPEDPSDTLAQIQKLLEPGEGTAEQVKKVTSIFEEMGRRAAEIILVTNFSAVNGGTPKILIWGPLVHGNAGHVLVQSANSYLDAYLTTPIDKNRVVLSDYLVRDSLLGKSESGENLSLYGAVYAGNIGRVRFEGVEQDPDLGTKQLRKDKNIIAASPMGIALPTLANYYHFMNAKSPEAMRHVTFAVDQQGKKSILQVVVPAEPLADQENVELYLRSATVKDYLRAILSNILIISSPDSVSLAAGSAPLHNLLEEIRSEMDAGNPLDSIHVHMARQFRQGAAMHLETVLKESLPEMKAEEIPSRISQYELKEKMTQARQLSQDGVSIGVDIGSSEIKLVIMGPNPDIPILTKYYTFTSRPFQKGDGQELIEETGALIKFALAAVSLESVEGFENLKIHVRHAWNQADNPGNETMSIQYLKDLTEQIADVLTRHHHPWLMPVCIGYTFPEATHDNEVRGGFGLHTRGLRMKYDILGFPTPKYWEEFDQYVRPMAAKVTERLRSELGLKQNIPMAMAGDAKAGAFWAGAVLKEGGILGLVPGGNLTAGYLDSAAEFPFKLYDISFMRTYIGDSPDFYMHKEFDVRGAAQSQLSYERVFAYANELGIMVDNRRIPDTFQNLVQREAAFLKLERILHSETSLDLQHRTEIVFRQMGNHLAAIVATIQQAAPGDRYRRIVVFGKMFSGPGGKIMIEQAQEVLKKKFDVQNIQLMAAADIGREYELTALGGDSDTNRLVAAKLAETKFGSDAVINKVARAIGIVYLANLERLKRFPSSSPTPPNFILPSTSSNRGLLLLTSTIFFVISAFAGLLYNGYTVVKEFRFENPVQNWSPARQKVRPIAA